MDFEFFFLQSFWSFAFFFAIVIGTVNAIVQSF
uniref:Uncharacterized protein n=1 Tax=Anguilla anguilla TaxID=7936 RepID=A0A0E9R8S9_ANGAN